MNGSLKHKIMAVVSVAVLAIAADALVASPAMAALYRPYGHVYNGASPRCLDSGIPAYSQLWNCSTSDYQYWTFLNRAVNGQITGNAPLGCLDEGAGLNGSGVALVPCNTSPHQRWTLVGSDGGGTIVNQASGRCLDADLGTIGGQGTKVQVWDCSGGSNQLWGFEFVMTKP